MFFTTIEEWVALAIMTPVCIFTGWAVVRFHFYRLHVKARQERYNKRKKMEQDSGLVFGVNIIQLDKKGA
tara:strand:- start:228 stop:437 length:210 start_codon:yes stop_codon:yes gene_type:complete